MRKAVTLLIVVGVVVVLPAASLSTIIHVPGDSATIQAGINGAVNGDTVLVADGTYTGDGNKNLDFAGKSIILKSENGWQTTILDCEDLGIAIHFRGEDSTLKVGGFTFRNAHGYRNGGAIICDTASPYFVDCCFDKNFTLNIGGAIYCNESSPTFVACTFDSNSVIIYGGAIGMSYSNPLFIDCIFVGNAAGLSNGGAIWAFRSSPTFVNCSFSSNSAGGHGGAAHFWLESNATLTECRFSGNSAGQSGGGIYCWHSPHVSMSDCTFDNNTASNGGGGMVCYQSSPIITNCTFVSNSSPDSGAAIFCELDGNPTLTNCIIAFNDSAEAVHCLPHASLPSNPTLQCCDIYGNPGGDWVGCIADQADTNGNFSADPLFCDTAFGDYHISIASPCAPANNSCGVLVGALGVRCGEDFVCGDANGDSLVTMGDVAFLQAYYFECSTPPFPYLASDLNCDGSVDIADIVYLAQFLNGTGPEPCCW